MFVCSSQDMGDRPRESRAAQCDLSDATWKLVQKKKNPAWSQGEDVTQIQLWSRHFHVPPGKLVVSSRLYRSRAKMQISTCLLVFKEALPLWE